MKGEAMEGLKVRSVTPEEVQFFFDNGWSETATAHRSHRAADLLRRAKNVFGEDGRTGLEPISDKAVVKVRTQGWFRTLAPISEMDEAFHELAGSEEMGITPLACSVATVRSG